MKIQPIDIKPSTYIDFEVANNDKDPKFKVSGCVKISIYTNVLAKGYTSNWTEEFFILKKIKHTVSLACNERPSYRRIVGTFNEKELQRANQIEFRIEKIRRKKGDKLYVKWKGYGNLINSRVDKKDIII